jgi:hypothetical protein
VIGVLVSAPGLVWYFLVRTDTRLVARRASEVSLATELKSIAVLPFVNMSSDKEAEYFCTKACAEFDDSLRDPKVNPLYERLLAKPSPRGLELHAPRVMRA